MTKQARFILVFALILCGVMALAAVTGAMSGRSPLVSGGVPAVVAYQGEVRVSDVPYDGDGYFKFAVVNADGSISYWSNDGSSTGGEPADAVRLTVFDGLFSVLLGDIGLDGMTQEITPGVFSQPDRYLRVWFSDDASTPFTQLTPDTRITAVPYALHAQEAVDADMIDGLHADAFAATVHNHAPADISPQGTGSGLDADTVDGKHAGELGAHYQNMIIVAKSGGDYTSVQAAIDSVTNAASDNPYLVWVAPGVYSETVTMKPYVHLQGAGQEATIITSTVGDSSGNNIRATLTLTRDVSLRDLTVGNTGSYYENIAILSQGNVTRTLMADVTAWAGGNGDGNYGIYLNGSYLHASAITLQQVTARAENADTSNRGMDIYYYTARVQGGSYTARGRGNNNSNAMGIAANGVGILDVEGVTALAEGGDYQNIGFSTAGLTTTLHGGTFIGRGGSQATGIENNSGTLTTESVTARGEGGSYANYGLYNTGFAGAAYVNQSVLEGATNSIGYYNGSVLVSHTRLIGGAVATGSITCVAVSRGTTFNASGCP